jgi:hypothetical protein
VACPVRPWLQVALGKARSFEAIQGDIGLRDEVDRRLGKIATPESRSPPEFSRKNSIHGTGVGEKDDVGHDIGLGKLMLDLRGRFAKLRTPTRLTQIAASPH